MMDQKLLKIENLHVSFNTWAGEVKAVRGIDFELGQGEVLAIVGESGCGKSVTSNAILGLFANTSGRIKAGTVSYLDKTISSMSEKEMEAIRGREISLVSQDPMTAINPTMKIIQQLTQVLLRHERMSRKEAETKALEMLKLVGIPDAERRARQYPFEFSGGMRQRVLIALALACGPKIVIADEPTTALDVTIQLQILELLKDLQTRLGMSIILITHDLGVVANMSDRILVMYAGKIVETASTRELFKNPRHPYTWGLLESIPEQNIKSKSVLKPVPGQPPDPLSLPPGCAFEPRCPYAMPACRKREPEIYSTGKGHDTACWLYHPGAPLSEALAMRHGAEI